MSTNKTTQNMIQDLVSDLEPVQQIDSPYKRAILIFVIALPVAFISSYLAASLLLGWEVRTLRLTEAKFILEEFAVLTAALLLFITAFRGSDPNVANKTHWTSMAVAPVGLIALLLMLAPSETFNYGYTMMQYGYACLGVAAAGAVPTYFILSRALKKAYIVKPAQVGFAAGFGSYALGLFSLHLVCPNSTFAFLLVWHITPLFLFALLSRYFLPRLVLN